MKRTMNRREFLAVSAAGGLLAAGARGAPAPADAKWVPLFNGKDLDGWTPKFRGCDLGENFNDTYTVADGAIKVGYSRYEKFDSRFGHLFWRNPLSSYRLRVEYRFTGTQCPGGPGWAFRNSGIMIHSQDPRTMEKEQDFPVSIEVQLLGGGGKGERSTGNVCSPGTNYVYEGKLFTPHCNNSKSKTFHGDQWVTIEVEVHGGGRICHYINGDLVMEYEQPQLDEKDRYAKPLIKGDDRILRGGWICLQAESHPVEFRKVDMLTLES